MGSTSGQERRQAEAGQSGVEPPRSKLVLATLAVLYTAQGIPFGFAAQYLPVVLRQAHYTRTEIAAVFWLQLPWQLKIFWAKLADHPGVRLRSRGILLAVQLALAGAVALYSPFDVRHEAAAWFALTFLCALFAATQDIFVDALAVRSLSPADRGLGNVAQVAGYRIGMLVGGAGLLLAVGTLGQAPTFLACAALIGLAGLGAFALRGTGEEAVLSKREPAAPGFAATGLLSLLRHAFARDVLPVVALATTYKLGPHVAGSLIKPMVVDAGWSHAEIGRAVVTAGTGAGLLGSALGGLLYRFLGERRALGSAAILQALSCVPLVLAARSGCPRGLTIFGIASEHLASGLGTTVLFAALMTATRPSSAGLHYTLLTSLNAPAIGGLLGGALGDGLGEPITFAIAVGLSLLPLLLLGGWDAAARRSAAEETGAPAGAREESTNL